MQKSITVKPAGLRKLEKLPVLLNGERPLPSDQLFNLLPHRDTLVTDFGKSVIEHSETSILFNTLAIIEQPNAVSLYVGETLTISIRVLSNPACTYQLYKDGELVEGATSATYTKIADVLDSGVYYFILDNNFATVTSNHVAVVVNEVTKPTITQQSEGGAYLAGETVNLFVVASGTQPITYQWYLDGEPISGATSAEYSFTMAEAYEGSYTCVASNALGSCESDAIAIAERIVPYVENLIVGGGYNFAMFLDDNGDLYCTGFNYYGNYGNGTDTASTSFVNTAENVAFAACQNATSFYLTPTGDLYAAGNSGYGQLGLGSWPSEVLTWTLTASNVSNVIPGCEHSFYISEDGVLYGVGCNDSGQLGLNFTSYSVEGWTPSATDAVMCAVGSDISMYIDTNGVIRAAGTLRAIFGLGDSSGISAWTQVATNAAYACFCGGCFNPTGAFYVDINGDLYARGTNWLGNLGTGDTEDLSDWTLVASNVASVAGAQSHSMYLSTTGDLYATGRNSNGQLGTGDTSDRVEWTLVATNVASFALPDYTNSFYIDTSGRLFGVGYNYAGVLGLGDDTPRLTWTEISISE